MGFVDGQVYEDELIMGMTKRESRSALLMLANAVESLTGDDDQDGDIGLNAVQAAIAEDAARAAIRVELPSCDVDQASGRARLSYRQAEDLFKAASGGATLHQLWHSALTHDAEARVDADADGQVRPHVGRVAGQVLAAVRRGPGPVAGTE